MWLVSIHIICSVARNLISSLKLIHYGLIWGFLDYWGTLIFWFNILLCLIKRYMFILLKQWIWEDTSESLVSVGYIDKTVPVSTVVFII